MNGTNSSATQKLCLISHLARFWADNGQPGSWGHFQSIVPKSASRKFHHIGTAKRASLTPRDPWIISLKPTSVLACFY